MMNVIKDKYYFISIHFWLKFYFVLGVRGIVINILFKWLPYFSLFVTNYIRLNGYTYSNLVVKISLKSIIIKY